MALKEKAPQTYQELEQSGKLPEFLVNHDSAMMESYDPMNAAGEAADAAEKEGYQKQVSDAYQAISLLDEQTLATWLDFSDPQVEED